jgi:hypothetical protein
MEFWIRYSVFRELEPALENIRSKNGGIGAGDMIVVNKA